MDQYTSPLVCVFSSPRHTKLPPRRQLAYGNKNQNLRAPKFFQLEPHPFNYLCLEELTCKLARAHACQHLAQPAAQIGVGPHDSQFFGVAGSKVRPTCASQAIGKRLLPGQHKEAVFCRSCPFVGFGKNYLITPSLALL